MGTTVKTKVELLESIRISREKLNNKFSKLTPEQMVWPGSMDDWSVKDILAPLIDWEQRLINWYHQGLQGEKPQYLSRWLLPLRFHEFISLVCHRGGYLETHLYFINIHAFFYLISRCYTRLYQ